MSSNISTLLTQVYQRGLYMNITRVTKVKTFINVILS